VSPIRSTRHQRGVPTQRGLPDYRTFAHRPPTSIAEPPREDQQVGHADSIRESLTAAAGNSPSRSRDLGDFAQEQKKTISASRCTTPNHWSPSPIAAGCGRYPPKAACRRLTAANWHIVGR
jgi:hypothetical protein